MIIPTAPCVITIWDSREEEEVQMQLLEAPQYCTVTKIYTAMSIRTDETPNAEGWQTCYEIVWELDKYCDQLFISGYYAEYNVHSNAFRESDGKR